MAESVNVYAMPDFPRPRLHHLRAVFEQTRPVWFQRFFAHPHYGGFEAPSDVWRVAGVDQHVAAADVDFVL